MMPPPQPRDEDQRQSAVRATRLLDTEAEERFDRVTRLAKRLFGVPIALVSLVDAHRQWFKSKQGLAATETAREISFCGHAILDEQPLVIENALLDHRFADNPLVIGAPGIRFYAGHPVAARDGQRIGTLCIISDVPRLLSEDDRHLLHILATMIETEVAALDLCTTDALTGLANLRGFLEVGEFILRLSRKLNHSVRVSLLELEVASESRGSKNFELHSDALVRVGAKSLSEVFGNCDLAARIGTYRFAILCCDPRPDPVAENARVEAFINRVSLSQPHGLQVTPRLHSVRYDPRAHSSLEDVLTDVERGLKCAIRSNSLGPVSS